MILVFRLSLAAFPASSKISAENKMEKLTKMSTDNEA